MQLLIQQAVLTDFRPIFITLIGILVIFLGLSFIRQRNQTISFATVLTVSITHLILGGVVFYAESNLVQMSEFTADDITLYLFIAIVVLTIANPIIYRIRNNRRPQRYRYRG